MEFLMEYNLTKEEIEKINKFNSQGIINNIIMNKSNVIDIIKYLTSLGITTETIKNLFIHQIGIFFKTKSELKQKFDEYELDSIVKSLNYDVNTLDLIEF